jgi:hypothetical protein
MNAEDKATPGYQPLDLEGIHPGETLAGEIVCDDNPGRCSIVVGGKLLTAEAFQRLLNLHEGLRGQGLRGSRLNIRLR